MFVYRRLYSADGWLACFDQACEPTTALPEPCALPTTSSSSCSEPLPKFADAGHGCTDSSTTIFQPTTSTTSATIAGTASAASAANAKLSPVSPTYTPTEQDASRTTTTESLEPVDSYTTATNATHAAHAEPCATACYTAITGAIPTTDPYSWWARGYAQQAVSSTSQRSKALSVCTTKMGDLG